MSSQYSDTATPSYCSCSFLSPAALLFLFRFLVRPGRFPAAKVQIRNQVHYYVMQPITGDRVDEMNERRSWFESNCERVALRDQAPKRGCLYTCPCCGYPTLPERSVYEICPLCWWEDDGQDDFNANAVLGGPNYNYSLTGARANFEQHLVIYPPPEDRRVSGPDSASEREIKQHVISLFTEMRTADRADDPALWQEIETALHRLHRLG